MFLMPARAVTQNYKMTLKTSVSKGHSYFGEVGLIILTLLGLKYLPGWVKLVWLFHPSIIDQYKGKNEVLEKEVPQLQEIASKDGKRRTN